MEAVKLLKHSYYYSYVLGAYDYTRCQTKKTHSVVYSDATRETLCLPVLYGASGVCVNANEHVRQ